MSAISNSNPQVPSDEIPPDIGGVKREDELSAAAATDVVPSGPERVVSSFPPRLVPYKVEAPRHSSSRLAARKLPEPSPSLAARSAQFYEDTHKDLMKIHTERKEIEKKAKKGLRVEVQDSPTIPVPKSHNPSPLAHAGDQTLFNDERLYAPNLDITDGIPPAEREVSVAPADPTWHPIPGPAPLPGTDRVTPIPGSPLPIEPSDPQFVKKVAETMLDIATKDVLDRLSGETVLEPPGDEKLALPQIMNGPWERIRNTMQRRAMCPYARPQDSSLTPVEVRLWGELHEQMINFANEVSAFIGSFKPRACASPGPTDTSARSYSKIFSWSADDVALAMQAAVFAVSGQVLSWERALQGSQDFDKAHKAHITPPEGNALGLSVETPVGPARLRLPATKPNEEAPTSMPAPPPIAPPQPAPKTWAAVAAPVAAKPAASKPAGGPVLNTAAIQRELTHIRSRKDTPGEKATTSSGEPEWDVQGKKKKDKRAAGTVNTLPPGALPVRTPRVAKPKQLGTDDLEVAFKPESPLDIDTVKARSNPNESRSCLVRLLKHCNEIANSREYKGKTDIRIKSFSYSRNGNCIAVFSPKTNIKEVKLFAPGLCGVMGLKGAVTVQRTSGWTRMRVSHFPAWAADPQTGEWLDRINSKEEILAVLQDFAPRDLLTNFPPVDVRFFKPDDVVRQCRPGGFETIIISVDDPSGEAQAAYTNARLSFGYRNSFVSTHTTRPRIAECRRCCSYQCPRPQSCSAPMKCYKCGERHDPKNHDSRCSQCRAQKLADKPGHVCTCAPRCTNCKGAHTFGDPQCPGKLKYAPNVPMASPLDVSKYATIPLSFNPPSGTDEVGTLRASNRTPLSGMIPPRVYIEEDEVMSPAHD